ncbi:MAG: flagellar hook-length control protein FliK [Thiobacillaceae bacterium]|nr:flagellar hook-length control protein FliK [Thiobacillaceae bacterium]MDW8324176.1 flagellar hook-length control protein FliK [Burkholderiales bacterium]
MSATPLSAQLIAWFRHQAAELVRPARPDAPAPEAARLQPGQRYAAEVLQVTAAGRSLVRVAGEVLDMGLPAGMRLRPGQTLTLIYLTGSPRPTFLLPPPPHTPGVQLSAAAIELAALLRLASAGPMTTPVAPLIPQPPNAPAQPLTPGSVQQDTAFPAAAAIDGAPDTSRQAGPDQIAQRLQQVLRASGLFYESHLARWVRGELSLETIRQEPQARLDATRAAAPMGPERMPEEAARLAARQLALLEGAPWVWQGQAWPGQSLWWSVREDRPPAAEAQAAVWCTELRLDLARLGEFHAVLRLSAAGLHVRMAADAAHGLARCRQALAELGERLQAAGLRLQGLELRPLERGDGADRSAP